MVPSSVTRYYPKVGAPTVLMPNYRVVRITPGSPEPTEVWSGSSTRDYEGPLPATQYGSVYEMEAFDILGGWKYCSCIWDSAKKRWVLGYMG